MNAKKFFLMIGVGSLSLGLLMGAVFGIFKPDTDQQEQAQAQPEPVEDSPPQNEEPPAPPTDEATGEEGISAGKPYEHVPVQESEDRRLTAEEAAQIAIEKTNGGTIKKVEFKRKDELFKVELKKDDEKAKLEIDAYTGDILSIKIKD